MLYEGIEHFRKGIIMGRFAALPLLLVSVFMLAATPSETEDEHIDRVLGTLTDEQHTAIKKITYWEFVLILEFGEGDIKVIMGMDDDEIEVVQALINSYARLSRIKALTHADLVALGDLTGEQIKVLLEVIVD